jgi:hypothetical protein
VPAVVVPVTVWALCCPFGEQGQFRPSVVDRWHAAVQHAGHLLPWSVLAGARCHDAPWPGRRYNACRLRFLLGEDAWHARRMPGPWP